MVYNFSKYIKCLILALCFNISIPFISYADIMEYGPGTIDYINANLRQILDDSWCINGAYAMDNQGNIYFSPNGDNFACNTISQEGHVYDSSGVQMNSMYYIRDKYLDVYSQSSECEFIIFDNEQESKLFLFWLQTLAERQGAYYTRYISPNGNVYIKKSELLKIQGQPDDSYQEIVESLCSCVTPGSTKEIVEQANFLASQYLTYDYDYRNETMSTALNDRRGVCYHYSKLLHDILLKLGISSEFVVGEMNASEGSHIWLKTWDYENNEWIYLDPTYSNAELRNGINPTFSNKRFIDYKQYGISNVPKYWEDH